LASGKVHFAGNIINGTVLTVGSYLYSEEIVPLIIIGSILGTMITPDMDLEGTTFTEKLMRKIPIIGFIWQISWYGYALLYKHRGLSHNIFLGTLGRILWLMIIVATYTILIFGVYSLLNQQITLQPMSWFLNIEFTQILIIYIAWVLQDCNHYGLDLLFKG